MLDRLCNQLDADGERRTQINQSRASQRCAVHPLRLDNMAHLKHWLYVALQAAGNLTFCSVDVQGTYGPVLLIVSTSGRDQYSNRVRMEVVAAIDAPRDLSIAAIPPPVDSGGMSTVFISLMVVVMVVLVTAVAAMWAGNRFACKSQWQRKQLLPWQDAQGGAGAHQRAGALDGERPAEGGASLQRVAAAEAGREGT
jgi:hypothetical protein